MGFFESYAIINLTLIVGVMIFSVEYECGTAWETIITLGALCPT